jgi:hypothetical protein
MPAVMSDATESTRADLVTCHICGMRDTRGRISPTHYYVWNADGDGNLEWDSESAFTEMKPDDPGYHEILECKDGLCYYRFNILLRHSNSSPDYTGPDPYWGWDIWRQVE